MWCIPVRSLTALLLYSALDERYQVTVTYASQERYLATIYPRRYVLETNVLHLRGRSFAVGTSKRISGSTVSPTDRWCTRLVKNPEVTMHDQQGRYELMRVHARALPLDCNARASPMRKKRGSQ